MPRWRRKRWWSCGLLVVVGLGLGVGRADDQDPARQAAERDARALGWLLENGLNALVPQQVDADAPPVHPQRQDHIAHQAKMMEKFFQPMLYAELELIRRCCGGLEPAGRAKILAAGRAAVAEAARGFAARQINGEADGEPFDPREEIRRRLVEAVGERATPEEAAAYRVAVEQRRLRHREAARVALVARLDRQLDLTVAQRGAIESDLERQWQPAWGADFDRRGHVRINDYPLAPDHAAAAITPHLDPEQSAEWEKWCRMAPSRMATGHFNWSFDGQGVQQIDAWWGR
ncbi:MAG: hypothetical protein ACKOCX_03320 [Planctomycetota bacterium]